MLLKFHQILFFSILITGTVVCVSSNSWFTAWAGLEINLMSMIPLMLNKLSKENTETSIKYFLTQAFASLLLIFSAMLNFIFTESMILESAENIFMISMMIKLGAVPFHFWFPQVIEMMDWPQCLILLTWQKIAPFILLSCVETNLILLMSLASALVGALGGINQTNMKLILTYSSISHLGWMMMTCVLNMSYWLLYFSIYSILSFMIINNLLKSSSNESLMEINSRSNSKPNTIFLIMNMLSLGGLPPLLGFASKLVVIKLLIELNMVTMVFLLVMISLISLYFYCRVIYTSLMLNTNKNMLFYQKNKSSPVFITLTISLNIFMSLFMLL